MSDKNILKQLVGALQGRKTEGNPHHDAKGRFASGPGGKGSSFSTFDFGGQKVSLKTHYDANMPRDAMKLELKGVEDAQLRKSYVIRRISKQLAPYQSADFSSFLGTNKMTAKDKGTLQQLTKQLAKVRKEAKELGGKATELRDRLAGYY